jgi:transposase
MSFQGKEFSPEMMQLVVNLKHYYDEERSLGKMTSTQNSVLRVSKGLSIGEATVKRIMATYNKDGQKILPKPSKDRGKPPYRISSNLQPLIRDYIRGENLKGQSVSLEKIRSFLIEQYEVDIPLVTLWRGLTRMGFAFGNIKRRSYLKERDYVIVARRRYLRSKRSNRNPDGSIIRPEVYLDETYLNQNHSNGFTWYLEEDGPWVNKPSGKGPRLIILHAITNQGWVDGAELVFEAKKRGGDYHGQMDWDNFSKWFKNQLLPNIPSNSLIILDNARYHNVYSEESFPTQRTRKEQLKSWLTKNDYPYTEDMLKAELLELCKRLAPAPEFRLDQLAEQHGHKILRTPQYHPELQPIETCWAILKNYVADHCDFTMRGLRKNLESGFSKVTSSICRDLISKVVKQEEKFWIEDGEIEKMTANEDECLSFVGNEIEGD